MKIKTFFNRFSFKKIIYENPETYYSFTIIKVNYINTYQVKSVVIVICNRMIKYLYEKPINKKQP